MTRETTLSSLASAMGLLMNTDAPPQWTAAVTRAAQLLAPDWDQQPSRPALGTLALALYTLASERQETPTEIPLDVLRGALDHQPVDGPDEFSREPAMLQKRIETVLKAEGHVAYEGFQPRESALWRLFRDLRHQWEPDEPMSDMPPGPSAMRDAVARIAESLAGLDDLHAELLPEAPKAVGPVTVTVTGYLRLVSYSGASGSSVPLRCSQCAAAEGNIVHVDGPDVTLICPSGHQFSSWQLSAAQVRSALRLCLPQGSDAPVSADIEGTVTVHGEFSVGRSDMPEGFNPVRGDWVRRHR
ncbi:hypothetical protein LN042_19670 [Kitasatospora sp. RB6PN24]|uniref:hypothetical protein n=1 Tax=Kitasatospora humi TaxID=2893891 RepID=UPI001E48EF08|nr:hypothetical protein [Kitasatospora humi]MCC9309277.1 hypothetical protein [Kitasatospora humi]